LTFIFTVIISGLIGHLVIHIITGIVFIVGTDLGVTMVGIDHILHGITGTKVLGTTQVIM